MNMKDEYERWIWKMNMIDEYQRWIGEINVDEYERLIW